MADEQGASVSAEVPESEQGVAETPISTEEGEASGQVETGGEETTEEPKPEESEEKKDANTRIRELAAEKAAMKQKMAELEAKVAKVTAPQVPAVDENALNSHLGQMREKIDDLRIQGQHLQADLLEEDRNTLIREYRDWKKQRAEQQTQETSQQQFQQRLSELDKVAATYQDHYKIPPPLWKEMSAWFFKEMETDKLLAREFLDNIKVSPVAAVRFAHEKAKPVFEAKAKQAAEEKKKREEGKQKQVGGEAGGEKEGIKTYQQLMNLGSAQMKSFREKNPKQYQKLFDAHMKQ